MFKRLRPVVLLCGKEKSSNRDVLRHYLAKHHQDLLVFYAEHVWQHVAHRKDLNALEMEDQLGQLADVLIILVESAGTFTELGAFSLNKLLRAKLLPIIDQSHKNDQSFINTGPIRWINKESRYKEAIFADFGTLLTSADEIDRRLAEIPRRGRLKEIEAIENLNDSPKHLLFLLCDLIAVTGPTLETHCQYYLQHILGKKPSWSLSSLLGLAISLELISTIPHPEWDKLYYRPMLNGQLESFQHRSGMFELAKDRARFLSVYQTIRPLWTVLLSQMKENPK